MTTIRQDILAKKITENYTSKNPKDLGKILKEAGYTKSTSKQPKKIMKGKGVKNKLKPVVKQLKTLRQKTINALDKKDLSESKVLELTGLLKTLNNDINLLSGEATGNFNIDFNYKEPK